MAKNNSKKKVVEEQPKKDKYALYKQVMANREKFPQFDVILNSIDCQKATLESQVATIEHLNTVFGRNEEANKFSNTKFTTYPDLVQIEAYNSALIQQNQNVIALLINSNF